MITPLGLVHPIKGDGEPCMKEKYPLQVPTISLFIIKFAGYNKCPPATHRKGVAGGVRGKTVKRNSHYIYSKTEKR